MDRSDVADRFMEYVRIDSETGHEKAFADRLRSDLQDLGAAVCRDDAGARAGSDTGNLYASFPGNPERPSLLFSCHMDTVSPGKGIEPVLEDGIFRSAGDTILGSDDKAGIAALMDALTRVKRDGVEHGPLEIVFTVCEEGGLKGSAGLDYGRLNSREALVLDSSGPVGKIITCAPSQHRLSVLFKGVPSHAGLAPEKGVSSINTGALAISRMRLQRIDEDTTANIGTFSAEGPTNIVRDRAELIAEVRSLSGDKARAQVDHMVSCCRAAAGETGAEAECRSECLYKGFHIADDDPLVSFVTDCCGSLDIDPFPSVSGGGSDANNFNARGIKALNLGCGVVSPHSRDESLEALELVRLSSLVYEMITRRGGKIE